MIPTDEPAADPGGCPLDDEGDGRWLLENPGRRLQRQAWEWALANRSPDGRLPAGAVIAKHFNRSPRWGRLIKSAGEADSLKPSPNEAISTTRAS
jgi:hypothetical protein